MNLKEILEKHELWLSGDKTGERANLSGANLSGINLSGADLSGADLRETDLICASLICADLSDADLSGADMSDADLYHANLSGANLSGAKNLLSPINYLKENFERTDEGYIVYKCFNNMYSAPDKWDISIGSVIEEEVNPMGIF